jgi:site-specific recombinase XerD
LPPGVTIPTWRLITDAPLRTMRIEKLIEEFIEYARHNNRKQSTIRHYEGRLRPFRKRCGKQKLKQITPKVIEKYLRKSNHWPDGRPKAQDTRRANVIVLEQLFRYALRMRYLKRLPYERLEKPPSRTGSPRMPRTQQSRNWRPPHSCGCSRPCGRLVPGPGNW